MPRRVFNSVQVQNWAVGNAGPNLSVIAGTTVVWNWAGNHNVWSMSSNNCASTVSLLGANSGVAVTLNNPGVYWYSCQVGTHCTNGNMIISVTVS